jgi:SAM-dependent methyltransferase
LYSRSTNSSKIFRFDELRYYKFGLALGASNILHNGLRLGPRKTLGKILQPVNSYTRFPEYYFVECHIETYLKRLAPNCRAKILDVGSPKCFGLFLAYHFNVELHLTDIDQPSVEEAAILWRAIQAKAKGNAIFEVQDAREMMQQQEFDVVYSMSVIEHVSGANGDSRSIQEMIRALKPGGTLIVTVPFGEKYIEQDRIGFRGAARETGDDNRYFFQRIYTSVEVEKRLLQAAAGGRLEKMNTIWRKTGALTGVYRHIGTDLRGLLGCLNPVLSAALNNSGEGMFAIPGSYGALHSHRDIYGDLVLAWQKESQPHAV